MRPGPQPKIDSVDRLFAGMVIATALRRGATRQELIDLAVRYKRLDVVARLANDPAEGTEE